LALVVDDEEMVRNLLCAALEEAGLEVLSASGGVEAKEAFAKNAERIRLVLLDLSMPDIGAGELYDALSAHGTPAKYVLVSGHGEQAARQAFGREGLAAFLQKPFRIATLLDLVRTLLDE
jgi:DNA-binding NtrC family response regulator